MRAEEVFRAVPGFYGQLRGGHWNGAELAVPCPGHMETAPRAKRGVSGCLRGYSRAGITDTWRPSWDSWTLGTAEQQLWSQGGCVGRDGLICPFLLDIALQDSGRPRGPRQQWPRWHPAEAGSPRDQRRAGKPSAWFGPNQHLTPAAATFSKGPCHAVSMSLDPSSPHLPPSCHPQYGQ